MNKAAGSEREEGKTRSAGTTQKYQWGICALQHRQRLYNVRRLERSKYGCYYCLSKRTHEQTQGYPLEYQGGAIACAVFAHLFVYTSWHLDGIIRGSVAPTANKSHKCSICNKWKEFNPKLTFHRLVSKCQSLVYLKIIKKKQ